MNNSLTKITYETSLGTVELDFQTVKNYLVGARRTKSRTRRSFSL